MEKVSEIAVNKKYVDVYENMTKAFEHRREAQQFPAMGYTSNLDLLCDFRVEKLNELLKQYLDGAKLESMRPAKIIKNIEDMLHSIVYYCINGIGGEIDVENEKIVADSFQWKNGMGGTAVQAAMALSTIGCPSIVHLTDDSKEVCEILNTPYIYTVSSEGELIHADRCEHRTEQEIHYIIQFKKGDTIRLGDQEAMIPASNRLMLTKSGVNQYVPIKKPYLEYVERHAKNVTSNVLSSFNCFQDKALLEERLALVKDHVNKYKEANPDGIVYFEDAHYHNQEIRKLCLETLYSECDIVCLNEEELLHALKALDFDIVLEDIISCIEGALFIKERFGVKKGIVVHTANYAMYVGETLKADIESGLICGNLLATGKAVNGWYATMDQIKLLLDQDLSRRGLDDLQKVKESQYADCVTLVPTKYIDKPKYTIGLGDSFVAGVQTCF